MQRNWKTKLKRILKVIFEYFMVTVGCFIMGISYTLFFVPNQIAPGGFSGLATVAHYLFGWPVGAVNFILCVPLFFIIIKIYGIRMLLKSVYGTFIFSVVIDVTASFPPTVSDLFLSSVFGGIILGIGIGTVYRFKGTTGGTDLLAILLAKRTKAAVSVGTYLMIIDFIVVIIAGAVFRKIELGLYAVIAIYACMKMIDLIQEGFDYVRAFYIFSNQNDEIKQRIYETLDRGVTVINAQGGYSGEQRDILLCVVTRQQISELKSLIHQTDKDAFVILTNVHEVLGEGFTGAHKK